MEGTKCVAIVELAHAGHNPVAIVKALGYPRTAVYDMYKHWEVGQDSKRKDHAPQSDKKRMP